MGYRKSWVSFWLGLVSTVIAFLFRKFELGMLILFYSQLQLSEAIIWKSINTNDVELNRRGTRYGKYILASHNIAIGFGLILRKIYHKQPVTFEVLLPVIVGLVFYGYITNQYKNMDSEITLVDSSNNLKSPYSKQLYTYSFAISLITLAVYVNPLTTKIYLCVVFTLMFSRISDRYISPLIAGSDIVLDV